MQILVTNECAITLFELYARSCCFYLLKCSLHWRNPYQSMHCVGGGGGGALPSPYPPPILTLPHLPSIPSLPPLPHPKKVCSFFVFCSQSRYKTRRKDIRNTAFRILPKMRKNLLAISYKILHRAKISDQ